MDIAKKVDESITFISFLLEAKQLHRLSLYDPGLASSVFKSTFWGLIYHDSTQINCFLQDLRSTGCG